MATAARGGGDRGGGADGRVQATSHEHDAILRRDPDGAWEAVAHDPRLLWPETIMPVAADGHLHVTAD